jgi:hypothetical protein
MRRWLVLVSAILHITLVLGLFVAGFWHLEQLDRPKLSVALSQPLPRPPAPAGGAAPAKAPTLTHKHIVHDTVLPEERRVETAKPLESVTPCGGEGSGEGSGRGSGDPPTPGECTENCGEGSGSATVEKTVVVEKKKDTFVAPEVIRGLRLSGETQIHPSDVDKTAMARDGRDRIIAVFKTCVSEAGDVASVSMMRSSGYPAYDQLLANALHGWRYKPYEIGGERVKACGIVTFVYQIK